MLLLGSVVWVTAVLAAITARALAEVDQIGMIRTLPRRRSGNLSTLAVPARPARF